MNFVARVRTKIREMPKSKPPEGCKKPSILRAAKYVDALLPRVRHVYLHEVPFAPQGLIYFSAPFGDVDGEVLVGAIERKVETVFWGKVCLSCTFYNEIGEVSSVAFS